MSASRIACPLSVVATVCVLVIFFFPAMQGPYSVVHGPVTALLAARAAAGLRVAMTGLRLAANRLGNVCSWFQRIASSVLSPGLPVHSLSAAYSSVLRC